MNADWQRAQTASEAVAVLRQQHDRLRELLSTVLGNTGPAREQAWLDVRRLTALHECAEALAVHPQVRPFADQMVAQREHEEHELGRGFTELEQVTFGSIGFEKGYGEVARAWVTHAEYEELEEFHLLQDPLPPEALNVVNRYVLLAEADPSAVTGTTYREMLTSAERLLTA